MKNISCIAIDDEPMALLVIEQFCQRRGGIELTTYSEPQNGIDEIIRTKPQLVFLDIHMSSINGLDIAHWTKEKLMAKVFPERIAPSAMMPL